MASLAAPLADAAVSMFAISTYDTDYVLVPRAMSSARCTRSEAWATRVFGAP
jgi:hypothetical protein